MYQDPLLRFLDATNAWEQDIVVDNPNSFSLKNYPGNPLDCFIFQRYCNIDEMESEDDEQYYFSTPDYRVRVKLNRFQTRTIMSQFGPMLDSNKIELIIKMAWNYPKLAINKRTGEWEIFNDGYNTNTPPMPPSGGPPVKTIYIEN